MFALAVMNEIIFDASYIEEAINLKIADFVDHHIPVRGIMLSQKYFDRALSCMASSGSLIGTHMTRYLTTSFGPVEVRIVQTEHVMKVF